MVELATDINIADKSTGIDETKRYTGQAVLAWRPRSTTPERESPDQNCVDIYVQGIPGVLVAITVHDGPTCKR